MLAVHPHNQLAGLVPSHILYLVIQMLVLTCEYMGFKERRAPALHLVGDEAC